MIKSKRAGEEVLSIFWIFIMVFIAFYIVICVLIVNGSPIDVRKVEAGILANKVADCVIRQGYLRQDFSENFSIEEECKLNFDDYDSQAKIVDKMQYYVEIGVYSSDVFSENSLLVKAFTKDSKDIKDYCNAQTEKEFYTLPKCSIKEIYAVQRQGLGDKEVWIKVTAGIRKGQAYTK